ncbi:MAG TPA: c-type cytochrome [Acetobacteraceae bacterium]|nr:c-type cytochrome [Acetobacteraceae bacterium]
MSGEPAPRRDRWAPTSATVLAALVVVAAAAGFVWLPLIQPGSRVTGIWNAICTAAGLIYVAPANQPVVQPHFPLSQVELVPDLLRGTSAESIGRGATLALRCTMCHGARGLGPADIPNLAGQYPIAIYKQLRDFQSGARVSAVMQPLVAGLSNKDMRDLAAYYAYLPRLPPYHPAGAGPEIVLSGAPVRNVAPCGACHGELAHKEGVPWLEGQPEAYLAAQLSAFAAGTRHNDINGQMRNVARQMTPTEIQEAAAYYANRE